MSVSLFVYGTLRDPRIQRKVFGRSAKGTSAVLRGFTRAPVRIDGTRYYCIKPSRGRHVRGLILLVTKKELSRIDRYEETTVYARRRVIFADGTSTWVYSKK